jgi:hypothetical protein
MVLANIADVKVGLLDETLMERIRELDKEARELTLAQRELFREFRKHSGYLYKDDATTIELIELALIKGDLAKLDNLIKAFVAVQVPGYLMEVFEADLGNFTRKNAQGSLLTVSWDHKEQRLTIFAQGRVDQHTNKRATVFVDLYAGSFKKPEAELTVEGMSEVCTDIQAAGNCIAGILCSL